MRGANADDSMISSTGVASAWDTDMSFLLDPTKTRGSRRSHSVRETTAMAWSLCGTSMDLVAYNFAASTAALQVSKRRTGCWIHGVVCCCPVRPTPKGGSDWTDMRDLDLDLD